MRGVRGGQVSLIFQDPVNAFNPSLTIGDQLRRMLRLHRADEPSDGFDREIVRMLARVGVDATGKLNGYAFNFSQGQLQRIMIAAACLAGTPALLLADEPTTSLDVTIEAQVLQLLRDLRQELGLALILVTHNLALVAELCDRVLVMYAGQIAESARTDAIFKKPLHPYTRGLMNAFPSVSGPRRELAGIPGSPPDLSHPPTGCRFHPRCPEVMPACLTHPPDLYPVGDTQVRCLLYVEPAKEAV